jgi:uncharacterized protein (TIGR04222 family)
VVEFWGISDSHFLVLYGTGLIVALTAALFLRWQVRWPQVRVAPPQLDNAELAWLAGGSVRAAAAVTAEMIESGAVQASRGKLSSGVAGRTDPIEAAILRAIGGQPRLAGSVVNEVASSPAVTAIGGALVWRGLLVAPAAARAAQRRAMLGLYLLTAIGSVRHVAAVHRGDPVGSLTVLLILTVALIVLLHRRKISARTTAGDQVLASAPPDAVPQPPPWLQPTVTRAGTRMALGSFDDFPDATTRRDLKHGAIMIGMVNSSSPFGHW